MSMTIRPLANIGAEIEGLDLSRPIPDEDFGKVRKAFYDHGVITIRGSDFDDDDHIRFSRRFGELKKLKYDAYIGDRRPEIFIVSNIKTDAGDYIGAHDAGMFWHTDGPFLNQPHGPSALHAIEIPVENGRALGDTHFVNTEAAWNALPEAMKKRLDGLSAVHSLLRRFKLAEDMGVKGSSATANSKDQEQEAIHPVARPHPVTGRKCLYVSDAYTTRILGIPQDESDALIKELTAHVVKPEFMYTHSWRVGDLVMWDNCAAQHKATFDYKLPQRRLMHRTTLIG